MVVVEDEWRLAHPPEQVMARLAAAGRLWRAVPGLAAAAGRDGEGRLRVRLGSAQVTLAGRGAIRADRDPSGDPLLVWEGEGRRARGGGTVQARATLRLRAEGRGTLAQLQATATLDGWDAPPAADAAASALRRLALAAREGAEAALEAEAPPEPAPVVDRLPPVEVVPPAPVGSRPGEDDTLPDRLRRAARGLWPVGVAVIGGGTAVAVWLRTAHRRRG